MSEFVTLLLFFLIIGLAERLLRAAKSQSRGQRGESIPEADWEEEGGSLESATSEIRDLIAEELGINLERRPRVRRVPGSAESEWELQGDEYRQPQERATDAADASASGTVVYPERGERTREVERAATRGSAVARRRGADVTQRRQQLPRRVPGEGRMAERPAISLERPRRPEDHERFHERYAIPTPTATHEEFHLRYMQAERRRSRRSEVRLPERSNWGPAQKAIVWAEVLGPPKGLIL